MLGGGHAVGQLNGSIDANQQKVIRNDRLFLMMKHFFLSLMGDMLTESMSPSTNISDPFNLAVSLILIGSNSKPNQLICWLYR